MFKKIILSLFPCILLLIVFYFDLRRYGVDMGYSQLSIVMNAKPIHSVLSDVSTPDSIRKKLELIEEIRLFAIDSLGLNESENYTTFYDQKSKDLLWNISACNEFEFKAKEWSFPIAGTFPYKGYFDLDKAKSEARELRDLGYDVRIRPVGGWSTLGWFKDPVLSKMLERSEGDLANLIIHELTHSTLFVKDNIELSENLATFVGDYGALFFLEKKFGVNSREYEYYDTDDSDTDKFITHMLRGAKGLDSLYRSFNHTLEDSIKRKMKKNMILNIVNSIDTIDFYDKTRFENIENYKPNNAHFMSFLRYNSKQNAFFNEFKSDFNSDFKTYLLYLKKKYGEN